MFLGVISIMSHLVWSFKAGYTDKYKLEVEKKLLETLLKVIMNLGVPQNELNSYHSSSWLIGLLFQVHIFYKMVLSSTWKWINGEKCSAKEIASDCISTEFEVATCFKVSEDMYLCSNFLQSSK